MRIPIREQLGLLVLLTTLIALAVVAIATWINNYRFVVDIRSSGLTLTASLKAAQVSANLLLLQSTVQTVSTRVLIQNALRRYRVDRNNTEASWANARADLQAALAGGPSLLVQAQIFPADPNGPAGPHAVLNATGTNLGSVLQSAFGNADAPDEVRYPPLLYPNITYAEPLLGTTVNASRAYVFDNRTINRENTLLLGPLQLSPRSALLSLTVPIQNNSQSSDVLGYMTAVVDARLIADVITSPEGLENSGEALLLAPEAPHNRFPPGFRSSVGTIVPPNGTAGRDLNIRFAWAPAQNDSLRNRHQAHAFGKPNTPFPMKSYPAVVNAFTGDSKAVNNAGSLLSTTNEEGKRVAVGYAAIATRLCDWVLIIEQDQYQAVSPIRRLRHILLACVFGTLGFILLLVFPIAHFSVRPLRRLRQATKESIEPPGYDADHSSRRSSLSAEPVMDGQATTGDEKQPPPPGSTGWRRFWVAPWRRLRRDTCQEPMTTPPRRTIRVPRRVQDRKHFVQDELTDLTQTFNEMSDELMLRYEKLEDRVRDRTRELELSKKAAEAANESKTLFVANISHEFRTPLNAILGLTAVCMEETDIVKIKQSLNIIYRSGDLLLHLLTDLLTFSKNQIGQQLALDEREFRLGEIGLQIASIFEKQASEGQITLTTTYGSGSGHSATGSQDSGEFILGRTRIKDVCVWGDQNRILQVIINLVSNSLKFTPAGQSIRFRVRCLGDADSDRMSRKTSGSHPHVARLPSDRSRRRESPAAAAAAQDELENQMSTALAINPMESGPLARVQNHDRSPSPSGFGRTMMFEFEVDDTGPGIPDHLQRRIFEPFVQGDLGLSKKYGGTGLGLSICSQLATLMGGTITLKSQLNLGSTFTMRIPLKVKWSRPESSASSASNLHSHSMNTGVGAVPEGVVGGPSSGPVRTSSELRTPPAGTTANGTTTGACSTPTSKSDSSPEPTPDATEGSSSHVVVGSSSSNPRLVGLSQPFFAPNPPSDGIVGSPAVGLEPLKPNDKVRILVAEDNLVNQEVVLRMLKLESIYDVTIAKDGREAFEKVRESMEQGKLFHLIFMDVQMPNLDGLASTRLIREIGFPCPIVALTAFAEESNFRECINSGMNSFLAKPIRRPALKAILKAYCPTIPEE
ncbi:MAG: Histidine kinase [Watsoniomyces obsoletus]|nr:MAG: Histidine kinase [Watsoniomyces obsoletus]